MRNTLLILLISLLNWSCYDIGKQLDKRDFTKYPVFNPVRDSIRANGVDTVQIRVVFPVQPDSNLAKVNFTTSEGVFVANNKTEYSSSQLFRDSSSKPGEGYIFANLRASTKRGRFRVNIEVPKVKMGYIWINYGASYPTAITIDKNKFSVSNTYKDEIQLIANLTSTPGVPHSNTPVTFSVIANSVKYSTDDPANAGNFREYKATDSNGRASVYFTPGTLGSFVGPASFTATAKDGKNLPKSAIGYFQIIP